MSIQDAIINASKELDYQSNENGVCFGLATMALRAILAGDFPTFEKRLEKIVNLKPGELKKMIEDEKDIRLKYIAQTKQAVFEEIKKEKQLKEIKQIDDLEPEEKKYFSKEVSERLRKNERQEEKKINGFNIRVFLEGVEACYRPYSYPELFSKEQGLPQDQEEGILPMLLLLLPEDLQKTGIAQGETFSGIYDKGELANWLLHLSKILEECKYPIAFTLSSLNHTISIGYNPEEKSWVFFNPNQLPLKMSTEQLPQLADNIIKSFSKSQYATFSSIAYVGGEHREDLQKRLRSLKNQEIWTPTQIENKKNQMDSNGVTWLINAARFGDSKEVEMLLAEEKDINRKESARGYTALILSAQQKNVEITKLILDKKAEVNVQTATTYKTALHEAACRNLDATKLLLTRKADPNIQGKIGQSSLHSAILAKQSEIAKLLLESHANPELQTNFKKTALEIAVDNEDRKSIKILLAHGADPSNIKSSNPDIIADLLFYGASRQTVDGRTIEKRTRDKINFNPLEKPKVTFTIDLPRNITEAIEAADSASEVRGILYREKIRLEKEKINNRFYFKVDFLNNQRSVYEKVINKVFHELDEFIKKSNIQEEKMPSISLEPTLLVADHIGNALSIANQYLETKHYFEASQIYFGLYEYITKNNIANNKLVEVENRLLYTIKISRVKDLCHVILGESNYELFLDILNKNSTLSLKDILLDVYNKIFNQALAELNVDKIKKLIEKSKLLQDEKFLDANKALTNQDFNFNEFYTSIPQYPLHTAIFIEPNKLKEALLKEGSEYKKEDYNQRDPLGRTPLDYAILLNREDLILPLLRAGAQQNKTSHFSLLRSLFELKTNWDEAMKFCFPNESNYKLLSFKEAVRNNHIEMARKISGEVKHEFDNKKEDYKNVAFLENVQNPKIIALLFDLGLDPKPNPSRLKNPVFIEAFSNPDLFVEFVKKIHPKEKILIQGAFQPENTLKIALDRNNLQAVDAILAHEAFDTSMTPKEKNKIFRDALMFSNSAKIIDSLLTKGFALNEIQKFDLINYASSKNPNHGLEGEGLYQSYGKSDKIPFNPLLLAIIRGNNLEIIKVCAEKADDETLQQAKKILTAMKFPNEKQILEVLSTAKFSFSHPSTFLSPKSQPQPENLEVKKDFKPGS